MGLEGGQVREGSGIVRGAGETGTRKIQYRMAGCGGRGGAVVGRRGRGGPAVDRRVTTEELFCVYFASSAPVPFPVGAVCLSLVFREQTLN